jgi:diguanylate cyclase (GGDEF)-like protein
MARMRFVQSVVFRLVAGLVLGGVMLSAALGVLAMRSAEARLRLETTQHVTAVTRDLQSVLRGLLHQGDAGEVQNSLVALTNDDRIRGARLSGAGIDITAGAWSDETRDQSPEWVLPERMLARGDEVDLDTFTYLRAPFVQAGRVYSLELLVDGPAARAAEKRRVLGQLSAQWLLLAVVTLGGLLLLRRWVTEPLSQIMQLIAAHAGPDPFYRVARRKRDDFGHLAEAIGGMLTRIESTAQQLGHRERAFQTLYQFAPAAMISLDAHGKITEANDRAAALLGLPSDKALLGHAALDFIRAEDRGILRQTIDRLDLHPTTRCELRVVAGVPGIPGVPGVAGGEKTIDALVECAGLRDAEGTLTSVQVSFLDVSESKQLQRQIADKSQLLKLVIDHISAAILLVDARGKIAAHNQHLADLVRKQPGALTGQAYDPEGFWDELGILKPDLFVNRLRQIDADRERPAQERFEARAGTFLFQGVPVHDVSGQVVGRLWMVSEISTQEQSQRLLEQQTTQMQALRKIVQHINHVTEPDALMSEAARLLFDVFGVEAVGMAVRRDGGDGQRSVQIIHRGPGPYLLDAHRALLESIEKHLMPEVLGNTDVTFWPDLPKTSAWAKAFTQAGLTCLAAGPLRGNADAQGLLWIARRGGERIERHHIYLLEALAPVIAGRLEIAQLNQRLLSVEMTDPVTGLPNRRHLEHEVRKLTQRPGRPWSLIMLNLDRFRQLNETLTHERADELLNKVAVALQQATRKSCTVVRLNGPTFAVLSPNCPHDQAVKLAERLRQVIGSEELRLPDGDRTRVTASVGVASCPTDTPTGTNIVELAAARMELAKRKGNDCVVAEGPDPLKRAG